MRVAIMRLVLVVPGARSLKDKRRVLARIRDRVRARFPVSVAEVDEQDTWDRIVLGIALVGSDARVLRSTMDKLTEFIEGLYVAEIWHRDLEIEPFPWPE